MGYVESFIINYYQWSYLILFVGMFIDGEAFFLTAAIFALQGYLSWSLIIVITFFGVIISDVAYYYIGRYTKGTKLGNWVSKRFNGYEMWLGENFLKRYAKMAFYSKFIYYVNRLTPIIAGWQGLKLKKFLKIHFFATIFWLSVMTILGYSLRFVLDAMGAQWVLKRMEFIFPGLILLFLIGEYITKKLFTKKIKKTLSQSIPQDYQNTN